MTVRAPILVLAIAAIFAPRLAAHRCEGVRGARVAAIAGTYVGGWALAAAVHPAKWWKGRPGAFRLNWVAVASPSAGQDYLLHVGATYEASQAAALAWEWACVSPATAVRLGVAAGHSTTPWITDPPARHVWFATLDLELRGLPVRARWWRSVATVLDQVHFPAPGVRIRNGRVAVGGV